MRQHVQQAPIDMIPSNPAQRLSPFLSAMLASSRLSARHVHVLWMQCLASCLTRRGQYNGSLSYDHKSCIAW